MATGKLGAVPPPWPVEARLAALLPDLLVFRKRRGSEPELSTAQGVLLGVHVTGLSAGRISQVIIGDEQRQYLLVIGRDVDGVQLAQRLAQANEIVLSWNCWKLCEQYMFEVEIMREDEAVKEAALYISTAIEKGGGQLSRIFMFEKVSTRELDHQHYKGCMFLCVFGLPGDKKPDECAHALESSFSIFSFCWENLDETKVLPVKLKEADYKQCFYAIQTLMAIFFEIDVCPPYYRQECLHQQLRGMVEEPLHCLFNDLFFVKAVRERPLIFLIDEAQYMDAASWEFLGTLLSSVPIIMAMTLTPIFTLCGWAQHFLKSPQATLVPISMLAATSLFRMACWELGVVSMPPELQMCFGNPLYCEVLCQDLLSKDILLFHDLQKEEKENSKWETLSDLLQHLLPGWDKHKLLQVLRALVDMHVFHWLNKSQELPAQPVVVPSSINIIEQTKEKTEKSGDDRTEEEFLDRVSRMLAQIDPEEDMLTTKACHCEEILKLVLSPLTLHCLVIGETTCAFYYLLEAAAASLDLADNYMVCFNMGQITLAKKLARQALRLLKRDFPWTWFGVLFQTFLEKYWHSWFQSQSPNNLSEKLSLPMWTSPSTHKAWATGRSGCTLRRWPFRKAVDIGSPGKNWWPQPGSCRPWPTPNSALAILTSPSASVRVVGAFGPRAIRECRLPARSHTMLLHLLRFSSP
ncbi:PREDICTED: adenylate cyclase type 10-like [Chrysochloris asiatica]|uniref:Adenylate cyclase type 10-like n=1 Tax=Chrysochloris asiatica TaxID=185453 RepID=A0A9B0TAU5_CHRAS|nr:PREDICTED: adenylate cyclase type 10-like [Chrysochloris asiatica]